MSDESVAANLRSNADLVVVEAPAGCGKTYQAADFTRHAADIISPGRLLILTHTHAACDVIARAAGAHKQVEVRTIDSFICLLGSVYHRTLGLPPDAAAWARSQEKGYSILATKVAKLMRSETIARAVAHRYPLVLCDEHQDSNRAQHAVVMALQAGGARLRIFGDPMQRIYKGDNKEEDQALDKQWVELVTSADESDSLDVAHRWGNPPNELGSWILHQRQVLVDGGSIDLTERLPKGLGVIFANNEGRRFGQFALSQGNRRLLSAFVTAQQDLLVLTHHTEMVRGLNSYFGRRMPIWEGHVRNELDKLVNAVGRAGKEPNAVAQAAVNFMVEVLNGFQASKHGRIVLREVNDGCSTKRRGAPALLQQIARCIAESPDHRGVGHALRRLTEIIDSNVEFRVISIDLRREYWDAARLADFDSADECLSEMARTRAYTRPTRPAKTISTIHKAKGLQCDAVLLLPCDRKTFPDSPFSRRLLYVALSRARQALMLVVPPDDPSPLFRVR